MIVLALLIAMVLCFVAMFFIPVGLAIVIAVMLSMVWKLQVLHKFKGEYLPVVEPTCLLVWVAVFIQVFRVVFFGLVP